MKGMKIEELLSYLKDLEDLEAETAHAKADALLLVYINDAEVTEAFKRIPKWYG